MIRYIYSLSDPLTKEIRYIGASKNPQERLKYHLYDKTKSHRVNWIKSLRDNDLLPQMDIVEETDDEHWQERERYWISYHRSIKTNLVNSTDGGEGLINPSSDVIERIRAGNTGKIIPDDVREKIRIGMSGIKNHAFGKQKSPEHRGKLRIARRGQIFTDETRAKISAGLKAQKDNPEVRARMSKVMRGEKNHFYGKKHTEESREKMRASRIIYWQKKLGTDK